MSDVAKWVTDVGTDAALRYWNSSRGGVLRFSHAINNPSGVVPVSVFMAFDDVLGPGQQRALENLLTDDQMDDSTSLSYLSQLRSVVKGVVVDGGIKAPAELLALPNKQWTFYAECRLRCDDAPAVPASG